MTTRFRTDVAGQATVEFALVMPILMLLVIGIIEFGRAWNTQQALTDAAREGARKAVIHQPSITADSVRHAVRVGLRAVGLDTTPSKVPIGGTGWFDGQGTPAVVTVAYPYQFIFLGRLLKWTTGTHTVTLRTSFTMRNE